MRKSMARPERMERLPLCEQALTRGMPGRVALTKEFDLDVRNLNPRGTENMFQVSLLCVRQPALMGDEVPPLMRKNTSKPIFIGTFQEVLKFVTDFGNQLRPNVPIRYVACGHEGKGSETAGGCNAQEHRVNGVYYIA